MKGRELDVIVWGASGFTGRLVAEYLAEHGEDAKWAIGGRNRQKLEEVARAIGRDVPVVIGDATDPASLDAIVPRARVVLSTVGPYAIHGRELVAACVRHGTDYCDLTGEVPFIRDMIDLHHERAKETGARIVHCCGFDSIPSDLGVLLMQDHARTQLSSRCSSIRFVVMKTKGGLSGGTVASMLNLLDVAAKDRRVRQIMGDPYALVPGERGPDGPDQRGARYDADLKRWTGPFLMAAINTRVVRRSNALLGYPWGKDFRYSESMSTGAGPTGWIAATAFAGAMGAVIGASTMRPIRKLIARRLPAPGEGPSKEARDSGMYSIRLVGQCESGETLMGTISGDRDPGYGETAKMIAESALCLANDDVGVRGGVLTPASCMGMRLLERLRAAGMTFEVSRQP